MSNIYIKNKIMIFMLRVLTIWFYELLTVTLGSNHAYILILVDMVRRLLYEQLAKIKCCNHLDSLRNLKPTEKYSILLTLQHVSAQNLIYIMLLLKLGRHPQHHHSHHFHLLWKCLKHTRTVHRHIHIDKQKCGQRMLITSHNYAGIWSKL